MSLFKELQRHNVFRVAIVYIVTAWLILQLADVVLNNIESPVWTFKVILLLLVLGFPLALLLAWAFELTPEGLKKEKAVDRSESISHITGRKLDFVIISVLAIAIVYFVAERFSGSGERVGEAPVHASVAVLPFVPLSSGEDDGYFADGLTEEILNSLAQLPELQVTARTSSFFFKGQNLPVPEIAARLNVAHIVEGSVRRSGEQVRTTAQLIRASDGFHLWSQTYDRALDDVFVVQEDIAENIAAALNVMLDDNSRQAMRNAGIRDVEAFIAYQKGLEAFAAAHDQAPHISEPLAIANAYFDRALEVAPNLTVARLMKTDRASHIVFEIARGFREEEYAGEAQATLAALREDYSLAWQLSPPGNERDILNVERTLFSEDWSRLPAQIRKAMQPGRCPQINWTNDFITPFGWAQQIAKKSRETLACDPLDFIASFNLSMSLIWAGDPEAALDGIEKADKSGISGPLLEDVRHWALLAAGRVNDPALRGPGPVGSPAARLNARQIMHQALTGDSAVARQMAEEYWSRPDVDDWSSLSVAAVVGDRARANELAARIDAYPGSAALLSLTVFQCFCGAPFDLEATPNYKARIEEAGFSWPPRKSIDYPTKTW